jgi:hypothetical protein
VDSTDAGRKRKQDEIESDQTPLKRTKEVNEITLSSKTVTAMYGDMQPSEIHPYTLIESLDSILKLFVFPCVFCELTESDLSAILSRHDSQQQFTENDKFNTISSCASNSWQS